MARKRKVYDTETRHFVTPANNNQRRLVESICDNAITVVSGPAGSGKTLLSVQSLYQMYKRKDIDQILVIRLITDTFGEHLGALPGEKDEKLEHFLGPIVDNLSQFLPNSEVRALIDQKAIEAIPVSHCRGRSFFRKGIIIEESQNLTDEMCLCILTRIAKCSRMVFNGDPSQVDFKGRNGINYLKSLLLDLPDVGIIQMYNNEVIRHPIISHIVKRASRLKDINPKPLSNNVAYI